MQKQKKKDAGDWLSLGTNFKYNFPLKKKKNEHASEWRKPWRFLSSLAFRKVSVGTAKS